MATVLISGATGNAGGAVVRAVAEAGEDVRALVRDPASASLPDGVEPVAGDLNDPDSFASSLVGVDAAFLLSGYERMDELLSSLRDAGARRVVLLSSSSVPSGDMDNAVARYHIESERLVRESGLDWTFLRPMTFMTNTLQWVPQLREGDVVRAAFGDVAVATIDPADIAAVAALALAGPAHEGRAYALTGPQALTPGDRVAILAGVLGRDLRFEGQSNEEARAEMSAAMPEQYVDAFFSFYVDGKLDESPVLPTVEEVTGRPPGTFEQWARAHADAFP
jgi:uncharacterized protein YbjT (DUF2867 family)